MSERCSLFPYCMAIQAFFLLHVVLNPHMKTWLVSFEVAAKEAAVTVPLKLCSAILTGDAVVVAYSFEVRHVLMGTAGWCSCILHYSSTLCAGYRPMTNEGQSGRIAWYATMA